VRSKFGLEHGGEFAVAVAGKEPQRFHPDTQVHGQVVGLLGGPVIGGWCGDVAQAQPRAMLGEDQHIQANQPDGVHRPARRARSLGQRLTDHVLLGRLVDALEDQGAENDVAGHALPSR
jgi:hypothetical protein